MFNSKIKSRKRGIYSTHEFTVNIRECSTLFSTENNRDLIDVFMIKANSDDPIEQTIEVHAVRDTDTKAIKRYISKQTFTRERLPEIDRSAIKDFYVTARELFPKYYGKEFSIYTTDIARIKFSGESKISQMTEERDSIAKKIKAKGLEGRQTGKSKIELTANQERQNRLDFIECSYFSFISINFLIILPLLLIMNT